MLGVINVLGVPLAGPVDWWNYWAGGAFSQNAQDLPSVQADFAAATRQAMPGADPAAVNATIAEGQAQIAYVYNQVQSGGVIPWDDPASNPLNPSPTSMPWWILGGAVAVTIVGIAVAK